MKILMLLQNINGLGFIDYSIEPHFDINNKEVLEELKEYSENIDIYALEDDAFIITTSDYQFFEGNVYLIKKGKVKKIK